MTDYRSASPRPGRPLTREQAPHSVQIAWKCVEDAMKVLGKGWAHVSDDIRWGLVSAEILSVVMGQNALHSERARETDVADVARYTAELWRAGMEIRESGWVRPWGSV